MEIRNVLKNTGFILGFILFTHSLAYFIFEILPTLKEECVAPNIVKFNLESFGITILAIAICVVLFVIVNYILFKLDSTRNRMLSSIKYILGISIISFVSIEFYLRYEYCGQYDIIDLIKDIF